MRKLMDWVIETWRMPWIVPWVFFTQGTRTKEQTALLEEIMLLELRPTKVSTVRLTVEFNGVTIWLGNYPYAYGDHRDDERLPGRLPSLRTAYRFNNYMNKIFLEESLKQLKERL